MKIKVKNSVYEPMEDSRLIQKEVRKLAEDKIVLDIGTGTGVQAISAVLAGAKEVWACDINPVAVECARENAELNHVEINIIESNLFDNIPKKKFDLIIFNPPYLPSDGRHDDIRWSGGYEGIEVILEFFDQVKPFLSENGKILFIFSSHANPDKLDKIIKRYGFDLDVVAEQRIFFEEIYLAIATLK
jgi:release factor glutamine methyltransferase